MTKTNRSRRSLAGMAAGIALLATMLGTGQGAAAAATGEGVWETTGSLSVPRYDHTLTLLKKGDVLAAGGRLTNMTPQTLLSSAEVYSSVTGQWTPTGSMAQGRWRHTATLLRNGRVLVTGGFASATTVNAQAVLSSAEIYDPGKGTWSPTGSMHTRRALHVAELLPDGRVLVAGGRTCDQAPPATCNFTFRSDTAEIYDPDTGTFTPTGSMVHKRHTTAAVTLLDGTVLIPAGFTEEGNGDTADSYDPATGQFTETQPLNVPRARQGAMLLHDGRVLVAGGFAGGNTSEVFDPATGTWSLSAGRMGLPQRFNFSYAVLPNGKALVAGGATNPPPSRPTSAELYDPATQQWTSAGDMSSEHGSSSSLANSDEAIVLSSSPWKVEDQPKMCGSRCGKVLIAGNSPTGAADLYTPTCPPNLGRNLRNLQCVR